MKQENKFKNEIDYLISNFLIKITLKPNILANRGKMHFMKI